MLLKIRNFICMPILMIGAHLWQPAFDKGTRDDYDSLTLSEKIGYHMMAWYIINGKLMESVTIGIDDLMKD